MIIVFYPMEGHGQAVVTVFWGGNFVRGVAKGFFAFFIVTNVILVAVIIALLVVLIIKRKK